MNSSTPASSRLPLRAAAGLLALVGAAAFLSSMRARTGGAWSPPLDDTYIYLQYARRMAEGHPFSYCDGAAFSTGASSLLHLFLLVPGWWAGFHGPAFVLLAVALGAVYLAVGLVKGARAAAALAGRGKSAAPGWSAAAAFLLIALNGHFLWSAFSGMDTALYAAGLVATVALVARRGPAPGPAWLLAGGLSWLRPEGVPMGLLALLILPAADWRAARRDGAGAGAPAAGRAGNRAAWLAGATVLLVAPLALNFALTRSPAWDAFAVKSIFAERRPDVLLKLVQGLPRVWGKILLGHLIDFFSGSWGPAAEWALGILTGAGLAAGLALFLSGRRGPAGVLAGMWLLAGILLGGLSPGWLSHYYRYQLSSVPLAALAVVAGWGFLTAALPTRGRGAARVVAVALAALLLWPGVLMMRGFYGRNCANILEQQTKVARWIEANTLPSTRVAVNDAGAIAYYGDRPILDLVGLTTHGWAAANHGGAGALFEKLESLPAAERPRIMAIYPAWYPYLVATNLAGQVLMSADLGDNTICGDRLKRVYRINWELANTGDLPVVRGTLVHDFGMTVVDAVDVEDFRSEAAHAYACRSTFRDRLREIPSGDERGAVVEDGGRWVSEGERMSIKARPGQWLALVMRTETQRDLALDVTVNGRAAGRLAVPRLSMLWSEPVLQIPDSLVTDSLLTVDVRLVPDTRGEGYSSYHYWFLQ